MEIRPILKRTVSALVLVAVLLTQTINMPVAIAFNLPFLGSDVKTPEPSNDTQVSFDLVALVIDKDLVDDNNNYNGLRGQFQNLDEKELLGRVERYAEDLVDHNEFTDVRTIYFDKKTDNTVSLSQALENLYKNEGESSRLAGVVLVGDIPLPVVNKSGNSFVSIFPYVDFEEKAYVYNEKTEGFERNDEVSFPKPEIWHGIIKAPTNDVNGKQKLAEFLDKNHLYYEGEPTFASFGKKMFFGDLIHESEQVNSDVYTYYLKYLNSLEDLAYLRYNKYWASELTKSVVENIPFNKDHPLNQPSGDSPGFEASLKSGDTIANLPDIYAKDIINQSLIPYYRLLNKYIAKVNDWTAYTGRYATGDIESVPVLISVKDEYTKFYLRDVGDALEKKINEVVEKIQEPLPLVEYSKLSGAFALRDGNGKVVATQDFEVDTDNPASLALSDNVKEFFYRFHYLNEVNNKLYVNGIDAEMMSNAKQCLPYLGSTKSEYYTSDLKFDPKAVNGKYSILTRSLRSDNQETYQPKYTAGVNTRVLSPEELTIKTNGAYAGFINGKVHETGAVIEDDPELSLTAFLPATNYENAFSKKLQKGDVITKINGKNISYEYSVDQAIQESFDETSRVIKAIINKDLQSLSDFEYKIALNDSGFLGVLGGGVTVLNNPQEIRGNPILQTKEIDTDETVAGVISVEFYRGAEKKFINFTFSLTTDEDDANVQYTSKESPDTDILVVLSSNIPQGFDFGSETEGAIFTLYNNKVTGFPSETNAYDVSAGCNAKSTSKNSDRCLYKVAMQPVFDPAGSKELTKVNIPGQGTKLMFPENVKKSDQGTNSTNTADYNRNVNILQFPDYPYEDVDQVYYNSCFNGLPATGDGLSDDSNPYRNPLDSSTDSGGLLDNDINIDFYGRLLDAIGEFSDSDIADDEDYGNEEDVGNDFDAKNTIWLGFDQVDAQEISLNTDTDNKLVTLADFAKRYGIIDGIDNDNDGVRDYEWRDNDADGVYETKWFDFDEADEKYGIPSNHLDEIARKLLSKTSKYTIPYGIAGFPYHDFDKDIVLNVEATSFGNKQISSAIIHNEPTDKTISAQMKSMTTTSLPIDNPRYAAFLSQPLDNPTYPEPRPINSNIDVQAILNSLDRTPYTYSGNIEKIFYPNLFDKNLNNLAQIQAKLKTIADQLALAKGSYRIFGSQAKEEDYTLAEISAEIMNKYFAPVLSGSVDDPISGFDLKTASGEKLHDALKWNNLNIDDKHAYILEYYLNGNSDHNSFVSDSTLFPGTFGYKPGNGYEAAYLVLDGEENYFDVNFNKDLKEEKDPRFDELQKLAVNQQNGDGAGSETSGNETEDGDESVWLDQFLEEVGTFIDYFTNVPDFTQACGFAENSDEYLEKQAQISKQNLNSADYKISKLELSSNKNIFSVNDPEELLVTVNAYNSKNQLLGFYSDELVSIEISGDNVFELADISEKSLTNGQTVFKFRPKGIGSSLIKVKGKTSGIYSGSLTVKVTSADVKIYSYTVSEIPLDKDQKKQLLQELKVENGTSNNQGDNQSGEEGVSDENGNGNTSDGNAINGENGGSNQDANNQGDGNLDDSVSYVPDLNKLLNEEDLKVAEEKNSNNGENDQSLASRTLEKNSSENSSEEASGLTNNGKITTKENDNDITDGIMGNGTQENSAKDELDKKVKQIEILKSTPVEEIIQKSIPIEKNNTSEKSSELLEKDNSGQKEDVVNEQPTADETKNLKWNEFYIFTEYYNQYLNSELQTSKKRYFTELFSDRMLSFLADSENPFKQAEKESSTFAVTSGDSFVANGKSLMKIEAQVFDSNGKVEMDSKNVRFKIENINVKANTKDIVTFESPEVTVSEKGIATLFIKAGKKSGSFKIISEVLDSNGNVDNNYPSTSKEIFLAAGEPKVIEIESDSYALVANNQSKTKVEVILKDEFGNVANSSFNQVVLFIDDIVDLDKKADNNRSLLGIQLPTFEGKAGVDLFSKNKIGKANLIAVLFDYDLENEFIEAKGDISKIAFSNHIGTSKVFDVLDKVNLELSIVDKDFAKVQTVKADGSSTLHLGVEMKNNGKIVKNYSGPVNFKIINGLGTFTSKTPGKLINGKLDAANLTYKAGKVSGDEEILVDVPGFVTDSFKFSLEANDPKKIELTASEKSIFTGGQNEVLIKARVLDEYGNLVKNDTGKKIDFKATEATSDLINFDPATSLTSNGVATIAVKGGDISGAANIYATSEEGLSDGSISLKVNKRINNDLAKKLSPRSLYISLLGGSFGNPLKENLAETLLNYGQAEAISALTASPNEKKRLISVDAFGKTQILAEGIKANVLPATYSFPYQKINFSDELKKDELASLFLVPKTDAKLVLLEKDAAVPNEEAIYLHKVGEGINFAQENEDLVIKKDNESKVRIDKFGRIFVSDKTFGLDIISPDDGIDVSNFAINIISADKVMATLIFKQNFGKNVNLLKPEERISGYLPGIYFQQTKNSPKYGLIDSFSGNSTINPLGGYLIDTENEIEAKHSPGFGYSTLEDARENFGLGFENNNKHMLLFASGNSVGESLKPYASEVGLIYGDPLVKLNVLTDENSDGKPDLVGKDSGYTKDLGKSIYTGQEPIKELINFDFNADGRDDVLIVYESGVIRLLENEIGNSKFKDRGVILNVFGNILTVTRIDVDNDGYDDLIAGTKDSCKANEECISLFKNEKGHFVRESLDLAVNNKKAYQMKASDINADGCEDLALTDSSGELNIFYNQKDSGKCNGLSLERGYNRSFGFSIAADANLAYQVFVYYPGMEKPDEGELNDGDGQDNDGDGVVDEKSNIGKFIEFVINVKDAPTSNDEGANFANQGKELQERIGEDPSDLSFARSFYFMQLTENRALGVSSEKFAKDVNGGTVALNDIIEYEITLENNSSRNISDLMISDATPTSLSLIKDSLTCESCSEKPEFEETGMSLRSNVIKNISIPANGVRKLKYRMKVEQMPKINFDIGNDFTTYPSNNKDKYLDFFVRPELNPEGVVTYIYSTGLDDKGRVTYEELPVNASGKPLKDVLNEASKEADLPNMGKLLSYDPNQTIDPGLAKDIKKKANSASKDSDSNGCADSWQTLLETYQDSATAIAEGIGNTIGALRCSGGGCIPFNQAFLAPDGVVPGISLFAAGTPNIPFFAFLYPSSALSNFRLYLSPTLSMGLGTAVCAGPSVGHQSPCFAFAVPGGIPGVCSAIQGAVTGAIAFAKKGVVDTVNGIASVISDGSAPLSDPGAATLISEGSGSETSEDLKLKGNYSGADDPFSFNADVNIRIPGFPSVITNWLDKQIDEIYNKLLDLPTFYFILPDLKNYVKDNVSAVSSLGESSSWQSFHDFMTTLNSIPLIQIEGKEIPLKLPAISPKEIEKYKYQAQLWLEQMNKELEKVTTWNCDETPNKRNICDKVTLNITELISSVQKLLNLLDQIANLPRKILDWRYLEAKYANQIVCYLDAIMKLTGGYINRQGKIIESWAKAAEDVIRAFKSWQLILDLVLEYQQSCDQCKNDRFSKLGLLLQLFVVIPEPPIIPLPKWPDIVVDLSQIKTGVNILWPDIVFEPVPIKLPNLPVISLPDVIPNIAINIPGFDVPQIPELILPDLPDLPPLPLPKLPDIPRPPKIPALPEVAAELLANLKPIFKILCLLKNGLLPVPEWGLATEIETLTQPSIQIVLPIIAALGLQWPEIKYDFVDEIRIEGKLSFDIDTNGIYQVVKKGANVWNENVKGVVSNLNKFLDVPYGEIISQAIENAIKKATEEALKAAQEGVNKVINETGTDNAVDVNLQGYIPHDVPKIAEIEEFNESVKNIESVLSNFAEDMKAEQSKYPDKYYLTASQTFIDHKNPLLNRTIAQVEDDIRSEILPDDPNISRLAEMRNGLIAYTKNLESSNKLLENFSGTNEFSKILTDSDESIRKIASLNVPTQTENSKTISGSLFGEGFEEKIRESANVEKRKLITANINSSSETQNLTQLSASSQKEPSFTPPPGFYVMTQWGVNENVLNYTAELKRETHTLFSDIDTDNDVDIVFSMGGDVYVKENYRNVTKGPKGDFKNEKNNVSDFTQNNLSSIENLVSNYQSNKKSDLSWKGDENAAYYEIVIRDSIDSDKSQFVFYAVFDAKTDENLLKKLNTKPEFILEINDKENPSITLSLPNGNYYANVFVIDRNNNRSLVSDRVLVSPSICTDKNAPLPAITKTKFDVSIFKDVTVDASNSFDTDGEISGYYIETLPFSSENGLKITNLPKEIWSDNNVKVDSDGDGKKDNDRSNPMFKIGPFSNEGDLGEHKFILHVVDSSGNNSAQEISVNVFAPEISIDESSASSTTVTGETQPLTGNLPFKLMRNRFIYRLIDGETKLIPRIDKIAEGKTDANGKYLISNFDLENMILVENAAGKVIAEINPNTGNVGNVVDGYTILIQPAVLPETSTIVKIIDKNGQVLGTISFIADSNSQVKIYQNHGVTSENYKNLFGVNVDDLNAEDTFIWKNVPANDPKNPGSAVLLNQVENKNMVMVDTSGNVLILDKRVALKQKKNDYKKDPFIFDIWFEKLKIAEIYIETGLNIKVVSQKNLPSNSPKAPSEGILANSNTGKAPFIDLVNVSDNFHGLVDDLYQKGIIDGQKTDQGIKLNPERLVTRKDFVKVFIKMLCIIPRESAYEKFEPGTGYYDLPFDQDYHPYIKEATLLGLIEGYKGDEKKNGLLPFKPEDTISRAEALKILLQTLEFKGILNLKEVKEPEVWYADYIKAGLNLTPYIKDGAVVENNFIITPEEALEPEKSLTFAELILMADRVLNFYSCFDIDTDKNGLSDFCEAKYNVHDPNADVDKDGLSNAQECRDGLNPILKDTDDGGVNDKEELKLGTNPLNGDDDSKDEDSDGLTSASETLIYKSDPFDNDTDDGGVDDGTEVKNCTNPIKDSDDSLDSKCKTGEEIPGIYIVPSECNTCPCISTFLNSADITLDDIIFPIISVDYKDKTHIFSKGNEVQIQQITPLP